MIDSIGRDKWVAAVSDSTNVTKAARRTTVQVVQTMLDLRDCVHHIQNTIKDITKLEDFEVRFSCNLIINSFSLSS